jgi:hypothetical protein
MSFFEHSMQRSEVTHFAIGWQIEHRLITLVAIEVHSFQIIKPMRSGMTIDQYIYIVILSPLI